MKKILECILILIFSGGILFGTTPPDDSRRLSYSLKPEFSENSMILHVEMVFLGDSSGQTRIFLPDEWAGQENPNHE